MRATTAGEWGWNNPASFTVKYPVYQNLQQDGNGLAYRPLTVGCHVYCLDNPKVLATQVFIRGRSLPLSRGGECSRPVFGQYEMQTYHEHYNAGWLS
jgi:hypothetical protein